MAGRRWLICCHFGAGRCPLVVDGALPSGRSGLSATCVGTNRFLLFGGRTAENFSSELMWVTVGQAAAAWDRRCASCSDCCEAGALSIQPAEASGTSPSSREQHAAALFQECLIVVGGRDTSGWLCDAFVLDLGSMQWTVPGNSAPPPPLSLDMPPVPSLPAHVLLSAPSLVALPASPSSLSLHRPSLLLVGTKTLPQPASPSAPLLAPAACLLVAREALREEQRSDAEGHLEHAGASSKALQANREDEKSANAGGRSMSWVWLAGGDGANGIEAGGARGQLGTSATGLEWMEGGAYGVLSGPAGARGSRVLAPPRQARGRMPNYRVLRVHNERMDC